MKRLPEFLLIVASMTIACNLVQSGNQTGFGIIAIIIVWLIAELLWRK